MRILSIETSCDDTCCALLDINQQGNFKILSNIVSSQIKAHAEFGGVVPSLAAREHVKNILPCLSACCVSASAGKEVDLIAVTAGPGLAPSLLVGLTVAKTLAYVWRKPLIGINHLEGHIAANFIYNLQFTIYNSQFTIPVNSSPCVQVVQDSGSVKALSEGEVRVGDYNKISNLQKLLPAICLIVSGGHTLLVLIEKFGDHRILGETRDDAAGEAFDKIARILGLGYPGGPIVAAEAGKLKTKNYQLKTKMPRPMLGSGNYDFSFSGLKTAVLYNFKNQSEKIKKSKNYIQAMCVESQQAIVDVLVAKTIKAAQEFKVKTVMLAGGVAANQGLRQSMAMVLREKYPQAELILPEPQFCTDNALMIALAAFFKTRNLDLAIFRNSWRDLKIMPNVRLD